MLNITENRIDLNLDMKKFSSSKFLYENRKTTVPLFFFLGLLLVGIASLFLPWTQTVRAKGKVTTLRPEQRPQAIQSVISGKLENWHVREGDYVEAGDTIIFLSEIKDDYFDPNLIERTQEQVDAKQESISGYGSKIQSLEQQAEALRQARDFKIEQTKNKIEQLRFKLRADSTDLKAMQVNEEIARTQLTRTQELYDKGLKSLTDLETKRLKVQETQAKVVSQRNKLLAQKNELGNLTIELSGIGSEYADKLAKTQSERFSAYTSQLEAAANTSKLRNELSNYNQRQQFYYVTAPQSGLITQAIKKGVGEIIKEGTDIVTIMPEKYDLATKFEVRPIDLPLLQVGQEVQILFDGWPAIAFSGWPNTSTGTFQGEIVAIDRFLQESGSYTILVAPSSNSTKEWPEQLRVGSGAKGFIMLNNVAVWYEAWRQLNGFPPDFYQRSENENTKRKAPIKSVK